jgi:hypothetical protein
MRLKDAIKSDYEFDKMLSINDSYLYHNRYILKLTSEEIEILKNRNSDAVYKSKEKLYYKGHEIERIDING